MSACDPQQQALEALIDAHATALKLPTIRKRFRSLATEAAREDLSPVAYLAALLDAETIERGERGERARRRRLHDARFPIHKDLASFRFADNPAVPQATIATLAAGQWIADRESVILVATATAAPARRILATALGVAACEQGRRVRFTTLAALATELHEARFGHELARVTGCCATTSRRAPTSASTRPRSSRESPLSSTSVRERRWAGSDRRTSSTPRSPGSPAVRSGREAAVVGVRAELRSSGPPPDPHPNDQLRVVRRGVSR